MCPPRDRGGRGWGPSTQPRWGLNIKGLGGGSLGLRAQEPPLGLLCNSSRELPRPHSGSAAPAAAHGACGISSQMGGTDDRVSEGRQPHQAHTGCVCARARRAVGGGGGGATPPQPHQVTGSSSPFTRHRAVSLLCKKTTVLPDGAGRPPPQGSAPLSSSSSATAPAQSTLRHSPGHETPLLSPAWDSHLPGAGGARLVFHGRKPSSQRFLLRLPGVPSAPPLSPPPRPPPRAWQSRWQGGARGQVQQPPVLPPTPPGPAPQGPCGASLASGPARASTCAHCLPWGIQRGQKCLSLRVALCGDTSAFGCPSQPARDG